MLPVNLKARSGVLWLVGTLLLLGTLYSLAAFAALPEPVRVDAQIQAQVRSNLVRQREALLRERLELDTRILMHNNQCSHVAGSEQAKMNRCRRNAASIRAEMDGYQGRLDAYHRAHNNALRTARAEAQLMLDELSGDIETQDSSGTGLDFMQPGAGLRVSAEVAREQREFDEMQAAWIKRQQQWIRDAVKRDKAWTREVNSAIREIRVPSPKLAPKTIKDMHVGDIFLVEPEAGLKGGKWQSHIIAVADQFATLRVFKTGKLKASVSHAGAAVKSVNGRLLFLDHTGEGSRILDETEFMRRYGKRGVYVARPQTVVDGRALWATARSAALKRKEDYAVFGKGVVCSERAGLAVLKASGQGLGRRHRFGPVDITPADFFDKRDVGKYFVLTPLSGHGPGTAGSR
jgi:hypothetical protein